MNRGIARRAVFLGRTEVRYLLSRLAREVREGVIELHEFAILTTHFHLLVRSPRGELSDGMRRVENAFVRWFNRRAKRDGSLFRGRFTSHVADTAAYRENVRRYIDYNAVTARLASTPWDYPYCSAHLRRTGNRPPWLAPSDESVLSEAPTESARWVVERRLERASDDVALDDLVEGATGRVREWMRRKASLADGGRAASCIVAPEALRRALETVRAECGSWRVKPTRRHRDGWALVEVGLLHGAAGLSTTEAALEAGVSRSAAGFAIQIHRRLMLTDSAYGNRAALVLEDAIRRTYPTACSGLAVGG